jgi:hypothetical protein
MSALEHHHSMRALEGLAEIGHLVLSNNPIDAASGGPRLR